MRMYARRLLVGEMYNMRELGGYATVNGGLTRWGRFIRSDAPFELSEAAVAFLVEYGLRLVVDLRMEFEAHKRPCSLSGVPGVRYELVPVVRDFDILGADDFNPEIHYLETLEQPNRFAKVLGLLADADGAALFHCSAGKDRTGMLAVFLLLIAGVPREDIVADYQTSCTYIRPRFISKYNAHDMERPMFRSDAAFIAPLLDRVGDAGGVEAFLAGLGVSGETVSKLRGRLLD